MQAPNIHHLSIEGDYQAGIRHLGAAYKAIDQLQRRLAAGGIQSGGDWQSLGDGAWLYARVAMGVNAVRIVVGSEITRLAAELESKGPPDFVSGVVVGGTITEVEQEDDRLPPVDTLIRQFWPTLPTQRKFGLQPGLQDSTRLAVDPDVRVAAVIADFNMMTGEQSVRYSQHGSIRPTMYSGVMKKVVQLLMGYGKQETNLYKETIWRFDDPVVEKIGAYGRGRTESSITSASKASVQIESRVRYDFRAYRTHGVIFDVLRRPWLVEVSANYGVLCMPLELHPDSVTANFRVMLERRNDAEALAVLDLLGGFPTGKTFPDGSRAMKAAISSGQVVQMLGREQMQEYYNLTPYSSALGWAFNEMGTEAHNTGYGHGEDHWQFGAHYALALSVGSEIKLEAPASAGRLKAHIGGVLDERATAGDKEAFRYELEKIDRLSESDVSGLLSQPPEAAYKMLAEMTARSIVNAAASLSMVSKGALVNGDTRSPCQAKFWEPLIDNAIISHDFSPDVEHPSSKAPERCDTTILVFFAGNGMKTVKWFADSRRKSINEVESDEEACMYVGSWTRTQRTGTIGPGPGYYTSDFDFREEKPDVTDVTITTGKDLGWTRVEADWPNDWPVGGYCEARRYRSFLRKVERFTGRREESISAFVWPAFAREAYYLAMKKTVRTERHSIGYSYLEMMDPNSHVLFIPYTGPSGIPQDDLKHCGNSGRRRATGDVIRKAGLCTEFIDEGPWMNECEVVDGLVFNSPLPPLPAGLSATNLEDVEHTVKFVSAYGDPVDIEVESDLWYEPSPTPENPDALQLMYATGNCFGGIECAVFSRAPSAGLDIRGKPDFPEMLDGPPCFIGVVN